MKALLIATTLMFGTAAMAQDAGTPAPSGQPMQSDTAPATDAAGPNAANPTPDAAAPADSTTSQPGATVPATNAPGGATAAAPAGAAATDTSAYPPCSRTVTDKCVSTSRSTSKAVRHKRR